MQPEDVQAGRMNEIYHESFAIAYRLTDPDVPDARYVTTALHVRSPLDPEDLLTPWYRLPRGAARRQFALLHQWFGGYYPVFGQLEECAKPYFSLAVEVDGTLGYRIASEYRMARMRCGLYTNPKLIWGIVKRWFTIRGPRLHCWIVTSSSKHGTGNSGVKSRPQRFCVRPGVGTLSLWHERNGLPPIEFLLAQKKTGRSGNAIVNEDRRSTSPLSGSSSRSLRPGVTARSCE